MTDPPEGTIGGASTGALKERVLRLAARRTAPRFVVLDEAGNVVLQAPGIELGPVLARTKRALERLPSYRPSGSVTFEVLDEKCVLRIVSLSNDDGGHIVVFIEEINDRGSIESVARRYHLTKREAEVLELVARGLTSAQVAARLYIAEATVGDHIKSLLRKTKSGKRSELVTRIYDSDPQDERPPR